jgi:hypothetical protein
MPADRVVTRGLLNDWILNDGLEHLFEEGYLSPEQIDPKDYTLRGLVAVAYEHWQTYSRCARAIEELVG